MWRGGGGGEGDKFLEGSVCRQSRYSNFIVNRSSFISCTLAINTVQPSYITVLLLGCETARIPAKSLFIGRIHGRRAHPCVGTYRNENGPHFSTTHASFPPPLCRHYDQALSVCLFMIGQLLIARPIVAIVLGKAAIFHRVLIRRGERIIRSGLCSSSASVY